MPTETPNFLKKLSVPRPSSGHLRALGEADKPIAVFSDFDGTIFLQDTGHILFDKFGCGQERREEIDKSIGNTKTFREASEELWNSLNVSLDQAQMELKQKLIIDPDFVHFFDYLEEHNVTFTIISAGMKPLLRAALDTFVGPERSKKIPIIANNGTISETGKWDIQWLHDSPLGIDKSVAIKEWLRDWDVKKGPKPKVVFTGDGVSDLAAANQADILFARQGLALEEYCVKNMIPYIPYMRFKDALQDIKTLIKGNRFHDPEAAEKYRRERLMQITGGLGPLTFAGAGAGTPSGTPPTFGSSTSSGSETRKLRAAFGFADDCEDEDEPVQVMHLEDEASIPRFIRPRTPPEPIEGRQPPPLNRQASAGQVPTYF